MSRQQGMYAIGAVAQLTGIHQQTIRHYERIGLLKPRRSAGGTRYFSDEDVERLRTINRLTQDLGVNLAGVEIILRMRDREQLLLKMAAQMYACLDEETRARFGQVPAESGEPGLVQVTRTRLAVISTDAK
jgi:MerR family transcriptional regulator/heat shock protein HspR